MNWVDPYGLWGVNIPGVGFQFPDFGKPQINNIGEIGLPDFNSYTKGNLNKKGKCSGSKVKSDKGDKVGGKKEPKPGKRHGNKGGDEVRPGKKGKPHPPEVEDWINRRRGPFVSPDNPYWGTPGPNL